MIILVESYFVGCNQRQKDQRTILQLPEERRIISIALSTDISSFTFGASTLVFSWLVHLVRKSRFDIKEKD